MGLFHISHEIKDPQGSPINQPGFHGKNLRPFFPLGLLSPWPFANRQNHLLTILQAKLPSTLGCQGPKEFGAGFRTDLEVGGFPDANDEIMSFT